MSWVRPSSLLTLNSHLSLAAALAGNSSNHNAPVHDPASLLAEESGSACPYRLLDSTTGFWSESPHKLTRSGSAGNTKMKCLGCFMWRNAQYNGERLVCVRLRYWDSPRQTCAKFVPTYSMLPNGRKLTLFPSTMPSLPELKNFDTVQVN